MRALAVYDCASVVRLVLFVKYVIDHLLRFTKYGMFQNQIIVIVITDLRVNDRRIMTEIVIIKFVFDIILVILFQKARP